MDLRVFWCLWQLFQELLIVVFWGPSGAIIFSDLVSLGVAGISFCWWHKMQASVLRARSKLEKLMDLRVFWCLWQLCRSC